MKNWLIAVTFLACSPVWTALAQDEPGPGAVPAPVVSHDILIEDALPNFIPGDLEVFLDGVVNAAIAEHQTPGATLAIVKDGRLLLAKGYGLASIVDKTAVNAEQSLFRIGSISKTFTWLALMQLEERGLLSLDDPINTHLPAHLRIPSDGFHEPIRIRHLMTHTAGFEDSALGHLFIKKAENVPSSDEYLLKYRPKRVRAAGQMTSYSNYGVALAGAIIAAKSGVSFNDYVAENILAPLSMVHTTFAEPKIGFAGVGRFAQGGQFSDAAWKPLPFAYISHLAPAGSASSTARDMARYMLALLNADTGFDGLLQPQTAHAMRESLFSNAKGLPGLYHGFLGYQIGALEGIGHDGSTLAFQSRMLLIPEINTGIFISTNAASGLKLIQTLPRLILERYFPGPAQYKAKSQYQAQSLEAYVGTYLSNRRPYSGFEKLLIGLTGLTQIRLDENGGLLSVSGFGEVKRWRPLTSDSFIEEGGDDRLAFGRDINGRIQWLSSGFAVSASERISPFLTPVTLFGLLLLTSITSIALLFGAWTGRDIWKTDPQILRWAHIIRTSCAAIWLFYAIALSATLLGMTALGNLSVFAYPTPMVFISLALGMAALAGSVLCALFLWPVWRKSAWAMDRKLLYSFVLILWAMTLTPLIWWGAIGWQV